MLPSRMQSYHARRTKLQSDIQTGFHPRCLKSLFSFRMSPLRCGKDGSFAIHRHLHYALHTLLTEEQQQSLVKKLTQHVLKTCFNDAFIAMLVLACFDASGKPHAGSRKLYQWLLKNVYNNNLHRMVEDWLQLRKP